MKNNFSRNCKFCLGFILILFIGDYFFLQTKLSVKPDPTGTRTQTSHGPTQFATGDETDQEEKQDPYPSYVIEFRQRSFEPKGIETEFDDFRVGLWGLKEEPILGCPYCPLKGKIFLFFFWSSFNLFFVSIFLFSYSFIFCCFSFLIFLILFFCWRKK